MSPTPLPIDALITAHAAFPRALEAAVSGFDVAHLRRRDDVKRWSPLEILVHLRDEEGEDFRDRATCASRGVAIEGRIRPVEWVMERKYNEQDPASVLSEFARERERSVAWLRGLAPELLERRAVHPTLDLRAGDFIAAWRMHDLLHLRQLATTLARLAAEDYAGWKVEYAGEIP